MWSAALESPHSVPSWKPGEGGTSQLSKRLQEPDHISHNAQKHLHQNPPLLPIPTLSVLLNLAPPSSAPSISRFFLPLSSTVPPSWRYAQELIGPSFFFDLWYTQHFLSRLWRPALCSIKTAVIFLVLIYKRKV